MATQKNLQIDGNRLWDSLMEMAKIGPGVRGGNNRQTLTDEDAEGRKLFARWCEEAGMTVGVDQMGTMFARREGTDPDLYAWVEDRMCGFDPEVAPRVAEGLLDYDLAAEFAEAEVPIRAILGQTIPLNLEGNRELRPDFDAIVMEGCGHYPMLERPEEFNQHLVAYIEELGR